MPSAADLELKPYLRALIYGSPGCGKTVFAHMFPGESRTLDFDDGMQSVLWSLKSGINPRDPNSIQYETLHSPEKLKGKGAEVIFDEAQRIVSEWLKDGFDTLIIDSGTTLTEHTIIKGLMEGARLKVSQSWNTVTDDGIYAMRQADWGNAQRLMIKFIQWLQRQPINIILLCHQYQSTNDQGSIIAVEPKLIGQLRQDIPLFFDEVYYMRPKGSKDRIEYQIQTKQDGLRDCKSRLGCLDAIETADFGAIKAKVAKFYGVDEETLWRPSQTEEQEEVE